MKVVPTSRSERRTERVQTDLTKYFSAHVYWNEPNGLGESHGTKLLIRQEHRYLRKHEARHCNSYSRFLLYSICSRQENPGVKLRVLINNYLLYTLQHNRNTFLPIFCILKWDPLQTSIHLIYLTSISTLACPIGIFPSFFAISY